MAFPFRDYRLLSLLMVLVLAGLYSAGAATHKVRPGDTLFEIARAHNTTASKLQALNGIENPRKLQIGQVLKLTGSNSTSGRPSSKSHQYAPVGSGKLVVIDPGHGGRDKGAIWDGVSESDLNLRVCLELESILQLRGYTTVMTRRSDTFVSLSERVAIANRSPDAIFVSVHFNATPQTSVKGAETYYAGQAGKSLALAIHGEMLEHLNLRDREVRLARFKVLMQTKCPAVLVECGFISNTSERRRCVTQAYCRTAAAAVAEGIRLYRWR